MFNRQNVLQFTKTNITHTYNITLHHCIHGVYTHKHSFRSDKGSKANEPPAELATAAEDYDGV